MRPRPLSRLLDWLEERCEKRTLARLTVSLIVVLLASQGLVVWYIGSVGLSMGSLGYGSDNRTVVVDDADRQAFERHYSDDREEGWCLYGSVNETHIRVEEVVHARTVNKESDRVAFSCLRETGAQIATGGNANLIGAVHSHPHYNQSYLSELDVAVFGRVSPAIEVMGVYTEPGGVAFFSEESLTRPLDLEVVGGDDETADGATASGSESG